MKMVYCSCIFLQYGGFVTFDIALMYHLWGGKKIGNVEDIAKRNINITKWIKL